MSKRKAVRGKLTNIPPNVSDNFLSGCIETSNCYISIDDDDCCEDKVITFEYPMCSGESFDLEEGVSYLRETKICIDEFLRQYDALNK